MADMHMPHRPTCDDRASGRSITKTSDVNIRAILGFGVGADRRRRSSSTFSIWLLFGYFDAREARSVPPEYPLAAAQETACRPSRGCRPTRARTCRAARAAKTQLLDSYGWVDKNAGVVRIPIDEAMKLTLRARVCRRGSEPADDDTTVTPARGHGGR